MNKINQNYNTFFKLYLMYKIYTCKACMSQSGYWRSSFVDTILYDIDSETVHEYLNFPEPKPLSELFSESHSVIRKFTDTWVEHFIIDEDKEVLEVWIPGSMLMKVSKDGFIATYNINDSWYRNFYKFNNKIHKIVNGLSNEKFVQLDFVKIFQSRLST